MRFGANPRGRVGAASPGGTSVQGQEPPCCVPWRSPRASPVCCNTQDVLRIHKVSAACLKPSHSGGVRKGKGLVEAQQSCCRRGGSGTPTRQPPAPGAWQCRGLRSARSRAACPPFINILDAANTGWVLITVLLESFCKDLYHSVSV